MDRWRRRSPTRSTWLFGVIVVGVLTFVACGEAEPAANSSSTADYSERVLAEPVDVVGNDSGLPRRVLPNGGIDPAGTMEERSAGAILADRVVRVVVAGERTQIVVSEFGEETLFDSWPVSSESDIYVSDELAQFDHLDLDQPIGELRANAGTLLVEVLGAASSAGTPYVVFGTQHHLHPDVLFVQAVAGAAEEGFEFVHPCPDVLAAELRLASGLTGRSTDESLALDVLTDKETIGGAGSLLQQALRQDGPPISVTPVP